MTPDTAPSAIFDRTLVRRRLARALARPDFPDFLHRRAADDIIERLSVILREFATVLVIADRPHDFASRLAGTGRFGSIIEARTVTTQGGALVCDSEALPVAAGGVDCIISLLDLHHVNDLPGALSQFARALRPDGLFMAALLGGTTLHEMRHAWLAAESELTGGAGLRVGPFADIRDMGGLLQRASLALPVVDADRVTVTYRDALSVMREIRAMGLSNTLAGRSRTPVTRRIVAQACAAYEAAFASSAGRVPATFEILYLTGWAPHHSQQQPLKPGSARARLADALSVKEIKLKDD